MKIAIIGSGISGLACGHYLHRKHEISVLEAAPRIGGHTATADVAMGGRRFAIDTGFIVYNDWTYPNFIALMESLGVATKATEMSFSLSDSSSGLEYAGSNLNTLFAQRRNLLSPSFLGMLKDIMRFNREAERDLEGGFVAADSTLGEYLDSKAYGAAFRDYYLLPMGSAIWSTDLDDMGQFPLHFFLRFFRNHGLLNVVDRPQWRVIEGGSREYLAPLSAPFSDRIRCGVKILHVRRYDDGVELTFESGLTERYDHAVFACHSDQALGLLADPSHQEQQILGAIPYVNNEVVLHTDTRLLPAKRRAWSAWNYQRRVPGQRATLTYNMNILQGIDSPETFCVTLNDTESINVHKRLGIFNYAHPMFTLEGMKAQERWSEINGQRTWYCGAYWRNGFHEDGVVSASRVADALNKQPGAVTVPAAEESLVGSAA
jgi:predicted NAD/FAD-binding protein